MIVLIIRPDSTIICCIQFIQILSFNLRTVTPIFSQEQTGLPIKNNDNGEFLYAGIYYTQDNLNITFNRTHQKYYVYVPLPYDRFKHETDDMALLILFHLLLDSNSNTMIISNDRYIWKSYFFERLNPGLNLEPQTRNQLQSLDY